MTIPHSVPSSPTSWARDVAQNAHLMERHGAVTAAHIERGMEPLEAACRKVARRVKPCFGTVQVVPFILAVFEM